MRRIALDRDKNDKKRIYGSGVFGSISSEMSEIMLYIAIIFITILYGMDYVQKPKIGNFPAFIVLLHRGNIHSIVESQKSQKSLKTFGTNNHPRSVC